MIGVDGRQPAGAGGDVLRRFYTAMVCLVLFPVTNTAAQPSAPRAGEASCRSFVQKFYDWYVRLAAKAHKIPSCDLAMKTRPSAFSRELRQRLAEDSAAQAKVKDLIVGIDFDPFLNAQDFADRYLAQKVTRRSESYLVEVHGITAGKRNQRPDVIPELVQRNGRWTFVNFHYPPGEDGSGKSDLLTILKQLREERRKGTH